MSDQMQSFENFKLNSQLLNAIKDIGYTRPTPIQEKAIPLALAGHDILGIAQTGTGKTAAYLLPLLYKTKYARGQHPRALILAPTRELVMQIEADIRNLGKYTDLRFACLYGGLGPKPQIEKLAEGVDIIIATPGRFMDLYKKEVLYTRDIKTMVLDEADKMMDMGFLPQIRSILEIIPVKRQNLLFSATFSDRIEKLSHEFLEFPERVEVAQQATTAATITQAKFLVPNFKTKLNLLEKIVRDSKFERGIVFTRSRKNAEAVFRYLEQQRTGSIRVIHANKGQNTRINSMEEFKKGNISILVATDVAARGLDVSMVSHVVNFDVPVIYEDYVHRIGRTGRAENEGMAFTFINPAEVYHFEKIEDIIRMQVPERRIPKGVKILETPFAEKQAYEREIDKQKKGTDPDYKGAFHEKKYTPKKTTDKPKKRGNKNSKAKKNRNQMKTRGKWKKS
ncbi:ATP-dependent RNA helicase RhlE [Cyclobacterium lianum]|uniref:ATP-dependent RNA helicase RhlE n=1 Tax=Cyclobacterium lianum TaxID=388280 RepID=A0A1M7ITF8_9BACT|nr:DEAD/DEAH box helicase [Cyclobacterium lianum]SHM43597.1 ATP-dependent RNA helicase RhlE [Cyclobacterium lianum]